MIVRTFAVTHDRWVYIGRIKFGRLVDAQQGYVEVRRGRGKRRTTIIEYVQIHELATGRDQFSMWSGVCSFRATEDDWVYIGRIKLGKLVDSKWGYVEVKKNRGKRIPPIIEHIHIRELGWFYKQYTLWN